MDLSLSPFLLVMMPSSPSCFEVPPFPSCPKVGTTKDQDGAHSTTHALCTGGAIIRKKVKFLGECIFYPRRGYIVQHFFRRKKNPTEHPKKYIYKEGKKKFLETDFTLRDNHATNSQNIFLHYFSYI